MSLQRRINYSVTRDQISVHLFPEGHFGVISFLWRWILRWHKRFTATKTPRIAANSTFDWSRSARSVSFMHLNSNQLRCFVALNSSRGRRILLKKDTTLRTRCTSGTRSHICDTGLASLLCWDIFGDILCIWNTDLGLWSQDRMHWKRLSLSSFSWPSLL